MSTQVKRRRGTTAENAAFTGGAGEIIVTTDGKRAAVHDGATAGGFTLPNVLDLLSGAITRGTASGTDTYTLTLPFFPAYTADYEIDVTFTNANTTSCTLAVNALTAKGLKDETGSNFTSGQIAAGSRHTFRYNGTEFRRVSGAAGAIKAIKYQFFDTSGTYTPSAGMAYCEVEGVGSGGHAGAYTGSSNKKTGGSAGGYFKKLYTAAEIGGSASVGIGAAAAATGPGTQGGSTTFKSCTAYGGYEGDSTTGTVRVYEGGDATGGDINIRGASPAPALDSATAKAATAGASSMLGKGGLQGTNGTAGERGGGGGAANNGTSAAGGDGFVIIKEYCTQ